MAIPEPSTLTIAQRAEAAVTLPDDARADAAAALDPALRIVRAREGLAAKLDELRRRERRIASAVAPVRELFANPWFRVGLAALLGAAAARR